MAEQRYSTLWRNKFLTVDATSLPEMADILAESATQLRQMHDSGVQLEESGVGDDYAWLYTYDPTIAAKFGMEPDEDEEDFDDEDDDDLWGDEEEEEEEEGVRSKDS